MNTIAATVSTVIHFLLICTWIISNPFQSSVT